jgi:hypothetical protein
MSTYCAEVLSPTPGGTAQHESGPLPVVVRSEKSRDVKVLLIAERPDGFFLERFTDGGALAGSTRHDTLDEALWQAYAEYDRISDWRFCPDGVDPLEYIRARPDS